MLPNLMMKYPKISVITINYNGETFLEKTVHSVCNQNYSNFEYIIIDGYSTDKSLSIIHKYSSKITKFKQFPALGIADAMNKGYDLSSGEFILFIHADDYLLNDNTLSEASKFLTSEYDIFAFNIFYGNEVEKKEFKPRGFNFWMNFKFGLLHQGVLCHRNVFKHQGFFDTSFKLAMDYDFFLRAYKNKIKLKCCNYPIAFMRNTGVSSKLDKESLRNRFLEEKTVHYKNNPNLILKFLYPLYWRLYPKYRGINKFH